MSDLSQNPLFHSYLNCFVAPTPYLTQNFPEYRFHLDNAVRFRTQGQKLRDAIAVHDPAYILEKFVLVPISPQVLCSNPLSLYDDTKSIHSPSSHAGHPSQRNGTVWEGVLVMRVPELPLCRNGKGMRSTAFLIPYFSEFSPPHERVMLLLVVAKCQG